MTIKSPVCLRTLPECTHTTWSDITSVTPTGSQFKTFSRVVSRSNTPCTKDDTKWYLTVVMKLFGLQGRTEKESAAKVALDITWQRG